MKDSEKEKVRKRFLVKPQSKVDLANDYKSGLDLSALDKETAKEYLASDIERLTEYQNILYAQNQYSLLIIFQAMDAAGKDSTIKHVMSGINPQGCQVFSFKAPSTEELDHDFLWRCNKALPERGRIGVFNRSYYEEVLVTRVHPQVLARQALPKELTGKGIWKRRFEQINNFEKHLVDNGTIVLKFFLNISKAEQKKRFLARLDTPEKNWKFSSADVLERAHWDEYMSAYEDCLANTSTEAAPWYVIPADHKPFCRLAVSYIIAETLKGLDLHYPKLNQEHRDELAKARRMLESEDGAAAKAQDQPVQAAETNASPDDKPAESGHSTEVNAQAKATDLTNLAQDLEQKAKKNKAKKQKSKKKSK